MLTLITPPAKTTTRRIVSAAEAISATTAGRRQAKTACIASMLRYFSYSHDKSDTMISDGRMQPIVATSAPGMPAMRMPTNVAELTVIGPGVISAMVIRSVNSLIVSQW